MIKEKTLQVKEVNSLQKDVCHSYKMTLYSTEI